MNTQNLFFFSVTSRFDSWFSTQTLLSRQGLLIFFESEFSWRFLVLPNLFGYILDLPSTQDAGSSPPAWTQLLNLCCLPRAEPIASWEGTVHPRTLRYQKRWFPLENVSKRLQTWVTRHFGYQFVFFFFDPKVSESFHLRFVAFASQDSWPAWAAKISDHDGHLLASWPRAMKKTLVGWWLFLIGDEILPTYMGIFINHYKDPY